MITPPSPSTGEIYLLNVPFDSNYHNVMDFETENDRFTYFTKNYLCRYKTAGEEPIKFYYDDCSYSRRDGVLYVPVHIDKLYDCNYLMFRNSYYSNKWFYSFVVNQKYVNDGCTALTIATDVYSTWQNDIIFQESFVEREHVAVQDDIPGFNVVAEGLETGELVGYETFNLTDALRPEICVAYNHEDLNGTQLSHPSGGDYNGIPSSVPFLLVDTGHIQDFLSVVKNAKQDSFIFTVFTVPHLAVATRARGSASAESPWYQEIIASNKTDYTEDITTIFTTSRPEKVDGVTPHNKKLLSYPYAYLGFTAPNGTPKVYRYENFHNPEQIEFEGFSEINPNPTLVINPKQYNQPFPNATNAVTINGYPMISYTNDVFNTWLAQNSQIVNLSLDRTGFSYDITQARNNIATNRENANATANLVNNAVSAASSTISGNLAGVISGTVSGINAMENHNLNLQDLAVSNLANAGNKMYDIRSINAQVEKQALLPDTGVLSSSNSTLLGYGEFGLATFTRFGVKSENIKRLDDFFDMYGYQVNELKIPNLTTRYWWNYVKTVGANIVGDIPESDLNVIKSIFDHGVTIWHHPEYIYRYRNHPDGENWEIKVEGGAVYE